MLLIAQPMNTTEIFSPRVHFRQSAFTSFMTISASERGPPASYDAAPIFCRRPPRQFAECRRERARVTEAHIERDLGHRLVRFGEKALRPLDAPGGVIAIL